jgi:hypothetical protein
MFTFWRSLVAALGASTLTDCVVHDAPRQMVNDRNPPSLNPPPGF